MAEIVAGVVIVNTFCKADSKYFSGYISYMDREGATRKEHFDDYNIFSGYMGYMGNTFKTETPERISGLFTNNADYLDEKQIGEVKNLFKKSQDKGSLMWQTVISFDNAWLQELGLFNKNEGLVDEKRLKNVIRNSVNTLLDKEQLSNGVWTAAIHYNTDNIHVHIATVEPEPMRQTKQYKQYEVVQKDEKWQYKKKWNDKTKRMEKIPMLDEEGNQIVKEEYVGKFKESSLKATKSVLVKDLSENKEINIEINNLIRNCIVKSIKDYGLYQDEEFRDKFLELYDKLPEERGLWNYGNGIMHNLHPVIDELSMRYIEKYHKDDFEILVSKLHVQARRYQTAYGGEENNFVEKKLDDLKKRMGNAILGELKQYDKSMSEDEKTGESKSSEFKERDKEQGNVVVHKKSGTVRNFIKHEKFLAEKNLRIAMLYLKRSLKNEYEHFKNQQEYEVLQYQIQKQQDIDNEL